MFGTAGEKSFWTPKAPVAPNTTTCEKCYNFSQISLLSISLQIS
ncbi:hypothetical protein SLEP1_g52670 [Rubroshorea leprosula]|uniref:Uncharacterized protein n=1 Tax=Rubroshorea leprosula TaxID=152421 RepID=A0AAV5M700_9ROSI|nr:hypothetical protein SLEP1_g52670 [Rubroshorea leprosula]